jgi:hypothetical protein
MRCRGVLHLRLAYVFGGVYMRVSGAKFAKSQRYPESLHSAVAFGRQFSLGQRWYLFSIGWYIDRF